MEGGERGGVLAGTGNTGPMMTTPQAPASGGEGNEEENMGLEGRAAQSSSEQQPPATPPVTAPTASAVVDILSSATSTPARRSRIIFNFGTREDTPPISGPPTASPTPDIYTTISDDSDGELPDLFTGSQRPIASGSGSTSTSVGGPSTPTRSQIPIKESDSQRKSNARFDKGKGPAVDVEISDTGDSDIEFIWEAAPPPQYIDVEALYSPDKLPASQAVLNSGRRARKVEQVEEVLTQTPRRANSKRRARPSASHARGRHSWGNGSGSASMSMSMSPTSAAVAAGAATSTQDAFASTSRSARVLDELTELHETNLLSSARRDQDRENLRTQIDSPGRNILDTSRGASISPSPRRSPSMTPALSYTMQDLDITGPVDPAFFEGSFLGSQSQSTQIHQNQRSTSPNTLDAAAATTDAFDFTDVQYGGGPDSEDDDAFVDEAMTSQPRENTTRDLRTPGLSTVSTPQSSAVDEGDMLAAMSQVVPELGRRLQSPPVVFLDDRPPSPGTPPLQSLVVDDGVPLTPPDIIITESKSSRPGSPLDDPNDKSRTLLRFQGSMDSSVDIIERRARVARRYQSVESDVSEVSSDTDSEPVQPRDRRRDVIIVSEGKALRRKHARARTKKEQLPELRFDSAESVASAESELRQPTPSSSNETGTKIRIRKDSDTPRPLGYRHRNAIVWTGRELAGEFRHVVKVNDRKGRSSDSDADGYNRARWESLVNDQLAKEEPFAPRVRVIDRASQYSCPPLDFTYTNRLLYRKPVPMPTKKQGCGCVDGCRADNDNCACARKQAHWIRRVTGSSDFQGFAYDKEGRLVLPDEVPIVECDSNCSCPADCMNRQISNGRKYALDIVKTVEKGWGVEAASDQPSIRKGSFLCIYSGEVIDWQEAEKRGQLHDDVSYLFDIDSSFMNLVIEEFELNGFQVIGDSSLPRNAPQAAVESQGRRYSMKKSLYTVDAMHYGNLGRFFNHACSPNAHIRSVFCDDGDEFKPILAVFAKKKIYPGDEITISYRGVIEGASDDYDSTTDEDIRGIHMSASKRASISARNGKRKKRSWRQNATTGRGKGRGRGRGGRGGRGKRAAPKVVSAFSAPCHCGSSNCDGIMFDAHPESTDVEAGL